MNRGFPPRAVICLDLQQGRLKRAADGMQVAEACRRFVAEARRRGWPVLHVQNREPLGQEGRSIRGLEPRPDEPVFVRFGASGFSNRKFVEAVSALGGPFALIGYDLSDTVLATVFGAADRELEVELVADAVAGSARPEAAHLRSVVRSLAPRARVVSTQDLLEEGVAQLRAANVP